MTCHSEPTEGPCNSLPRRKVLPCCCSILRTAWLRPRRLAGVVLGTLLLAGALAAAPLAWARNPKSAQCPPSSSSKSCTAAETMPGVKPGSIDDVNAIGLRKLGGRGLGNWYSPQTEREWGNRIAAQVLQSAKIVHDPVVEEYVNRIGQNIARNSDAKVPFTIKVVDTDEINAFALPGGYFFVNSGLILAAGNEAQLAAVMAHEIAHVAAHHQAREMTRMHYADIGMVPLVMVTGYGLAAYGIYEASSVAIPVTFLQFQRKFEEQADWLGVEYLYKTGYDPEQMTAFFKKIEALQKTRPHLISRAFSTHPQTPERVARTEREIATILPPRAEYVVDTSEFHAIQARLRRIENRRPVPPGANPNQPTLRRVGANPTPPATPPSEDEQRPKISAHPQ